MKLLEVNLADNGAYSVILMYRSNYEYLISKLYALIERFGFSTNALPSLRVRILLGSFVLFAFRFDAIAMKVFI